MRSLAVVFFATSGFMTATAGAEDTTETAGRHLQKIVQVRDVRSEPDQVSAVLVNLSSKLVRNVRVRIDRSVVGLEQAG